ncbi:MAG: (Fe-S)-binding protein [Gemmatimonadaceae bacterium]
MNEVGLPCVIPGTPLAGAVPGIMTCVHCGFCLQACPTYLALGDENDSPRGRILLMRSLVEGTLDVSDPAVHTHIDRCLGCRACETACPSGVPYGHLLEATRATLGQVRPPPATARFILWVFSQQPLLVLLLSLARALRATRLPAALARLPGRLGFAMAMLASTAPPFAGRGRVYRKRGNGTRERVAILRGCVMRGLFSHTNRATERTLAANDYEVVAAPAQRCCGALHAHAGQLDAARRLARANISAFEQSAADLIGVNAAGCGAMMKDYGHLLADDDEWSARAKLMAARVRDVTELLANAGPVEGGSLPLRVAYDAPCHLLHAQRVSAAPLVVLSRIRELDTQILDGAEHCCGSAGIYNLIEPDVSDAVLAPKLVSIERSGADWLATGNPGCLMQIGAGLMRAHGRSVRVVHPVDLLDASYGARPHDGAKRETTAPRTGAVARSASP